MIEGLHSCKPGNDPTVGAVKTFVIMQMTGKSGNPYTKIKSAPAEQGGTPYKILSVKPTGHTDSYGNISFNIAIEPTTAPLTQPAPQTQPQGIVGAAQGSWGRSPETQARIERQHSQEMALRYCAVKGIVELDTGELRTLIDWFQRDIGHTPSNPVEQATQFAEEELKDVRPSEDPDERPF